MALLTFAEVARAAHSSAHQAPGLDPGLEVVKFHDPQADFHDPQVVVSSACHAVVVEIKPDTGEVLVLRYVTVEDCGPQISRGIVEGQVLGGVAQGIENALYNEIVYDEDGQLLSGSLMDYALVTAEGMPALEMHHIETPSPLTPRGHKGVGESGIIGVAAALGNAVADALSEAGEASVTRLPLSVERVWRLVQVAKRG